MSTGFSGAESGRIQIGDIVAIFAQGPIGLCATAGAKLLGDTMIIGVDGIARHAHYERSTQKATDGRSLIATLGLTFSEDGPTFLSYNWELFAAGIASGIRAHHRIGGGAAMRRAPVFL